MNCRTRSGSLLRLSRRFLQTSQVSVPLSNPAVFGSVPSSTATSTKSWQSHNLQSLGGLSRTAKPASLALSREETKPGLTEAAQSELGSSHTTLPTSESTLSEKPKRKLRPRKAAIKLSDSAVKHLEALLNSPDPKFIRIGVKNRGCSGLTYHLEYVDQPGKFDEEVIQDGVKVLIDSKALFSIIGSEMDWVDDKLASRFVFTNPNSKGQCGCGESFMV
jgi:iron-sulfur cluster assembly 1